MTDWPNFWVGLASVLLGVFVAYHVYLLQKKVSISDKLKHREAMRRIVEKRAGDIRNRQLNSEVMIVNIKRYENDYVSENTKNKDGYVERRSELKGARYDGVEFFDSIHEVFIKKNGQYTINETENGAGFQVYRAGVIPYDWIKHINLGGDEFRYSPIFFTEYKANNKEPFAEILYYQHVEGDHYELVEISDDISMLAKIKNTLNSLIIGKY